MITTGKAVSAATALASGLIDAVDDDPIACAQHLSLDEILANPPSTRCLNQPLTVPLSLPRKTPLPAGCEANRPIEALNLVKQASKADFYQAWQLSAPLFAAAKKPQAAALRHVFFAERGARAPLRWPTLLQRQ